MAKIVRRPDFADGGITGEERAAMAEHVKLWTARAFRTQPADPEKLVPAIEGLYAAAGLEKPRVVIAPSPLVMAFAYGAAAAIWHKRGVAATSAATRDATWTATSDATWTATRTATWTATRDATSAATRDATWTATSAATRAATSAATWTATSAATRAATWTATRDATSAATRDATWTATSAATRAATRAATWTATRDATSAATEAATRDATSDATRAATEAATRDATSDATRAATRACFEIAGGFGLECAKRWSSVYQGGAYWCAYDAYLTACRDILGLKLPEHQTYQHWEQAAIHGTFRVMHEKFCIVSDFPSEIHIDEQNRPHCETGPSHRWRDGWSLYHWHGVSVPAHWIEDRHNLSASEVLREENVERRMAGCQIIGWAEVADQLGRRILDGDPDSDIGALVELTLPGLPDPGRFLMAKCPRNGTICEGVPTVSDIDGLPINTAVAAQAWRDCLPASEYTHPAIRT